MKDFYAIDVEDQCRILAELLTRISGADLRSIEDLAVQQGSTTEKVWSNIDKSVGLKECTIPTRLFGHQDP
jgi:hypothetical protein